LQSFVLSVGLYTHDMYSSVIVMSLKDWWSWNQVHRPKNISTTVNAENCK